jgi:5-methylcytosine-specific restriction endonuclease McrA
VSSTYVPAALRRRVQERAAGNCEYCLLSEDDAYFSHEPDHIIADKHGGETSLENLCWACFDCNRFKGSDIASRDPLNGDLVPLFNPRVDDWHKHFKVQRGTIRALTPIGRATERLLKFNLYERVEVRETLAKLGRYPTT